MTWAVSDLPLRFSFGAWRRLVAHSLGVRVVVGSNPAAPISSSGPHGVKPSATSKFASVGCRC